MMISIHRILLTAGILLSLCGSVFSAPEAGEYFAIKVVDEETGRGVPLVELKTTSNLRYWTDSNGLVAFYEPGLMDEEVFFHVKSHGYEYPKDGFGYAGVRLKISEGGSAEIKIKRINIAERLYRITGQGIYSDSILLGIPVPLKQPALNGLVTGQDSVLTTLYKGNVFWVWGDTGKPSYPLGNFQVTAATSSPPWRSGLDPEAGVDLEYFVGENGFVKQMAPVPGSGPTWLAALISLIDGTDRERLFARYAKVDQSMKAQEIGWMEFNDRTEMFEIIRKMDLDAPIKPGNHPFRVKDGGDEYIHFSPITRVCANIESLTDSSTYEAFTCVGSSKLGDDAVYGDFFTWKKNIPALFPQDEARLVKEGAVKNALFHIQDADTGKPIVYHGSSVAWNEHRKRWIMIMSEIFGTSFLGEVWYLEADTPLGPWVYARKIVTHDRYSFYNPRHHPFFDKEKGKEIFFEATYTDFLTGREERTPRYDYNQIMYKLDLTDPRLALPVPIYDLSEDGNGGRFSTVHAVPRHLHDVPVDFFAPDLPGIGTIPIYQEDGRLSLSGESSPVFYALSPDAAEPPEVVTPLYEFVRSDGKRAYTTDAGWSMEGFIRTEEPVCLVWKNPMTVSLPLNRYFPGSRP